MRLDLPYPHKDLWPNGRAHWAAKAREVKKHRGWALLLAKGHRGLVLADGTLPIHITVHGKPSGPLPDRDGVVSASKSYLDGIAEAIGVNDRHFAAPTVEFAPERKSRFVIEVGQ